MACYLQVNSDLSQLKEKGTKLRAEIEHLWKVINSASHKVCCVKHTHAIFYIMYHFICNIQ